METIKQQKKNHQLRMNVTQLDDYYYKEPKPLTEEQKIELLYEEENIKKKIIYLQQQERIWNEKNYSDKELRDFWF